MYIGQALSAVLRTKHFGPQSICSSSVSPETPFASPLSYLASKSNRGPGTEAARPPPLPQETLHRPLAQLTIRAQSIDSDDDTLAVYQYLHLSPGFREASVSWWGGQRRMERGHQQTDLIQYNQTRTQQNMAISEQLCRASL